MCKSDITADSGSPLAQACEGLPGHDIDAATSFRQHLFLGLPWNGDETSTGEIREDALVTLTVEILGRPLGDLALPVSHAPNRQAGQANYTSLLHLGPLSDEFIQNDLSGRAITLERRAGDRFSLTIS